jgi:hypothetical protein
LGVVALALAALAIVTSIAMTNSSAMEVDRILARLGDHSLSESTMNTMANVALLELGGIGLGSLGVLMIVVGTIIREIRQSAFEAALRAGEVQSNPLRSEAAQGPSA